MEQPDNNKILIAPLNWGLGHATRCIPIIKALIKNNFTPIIASDGAALDLLKKEFPNLKNYELPSYNITYPRYSNLFLIHFFIKIPHFYKTFKAENKAIQNISKVENIKGIISDNRFGCYHSKIKSVYITHQLRVLSGLLTFLTSKIHQKIIQNYDVCWVPDDISHTFSGRLSKVSLSNVKTVYLGLLSRFKSLNTTIKYNFLILISGPEPERYRFEALMRKTFKNTPQKVILIQGKIEQQQSTKRVDNIEIVNFMTGIQLQQTIAESNIIIARSGYSTIMDLAVMGKKAFFIPTPGQREQLYMAQNLKRQKIATFALQHQFKKENLNKIEYYNGFESTPISEEIINKALAVFK